MTSSPNVAVMLVRGLMLVRGGPIRGGLMLVRGGPIRNVLANKALWMLPYHSVSGGGDAAAEASATEQLQAHIVAVACRPA